MLFIRKYARVGLIVLGIWTAVGLMFSGVGFLAIVSENRPETLWTVLASGLGRAYVWGIFSPLIYWFAARFPIDPRSLKWQYLCGNFVFGIAISALYSSVFVAIAWSLSPNYFGQTQVGALLVQRLLVPALYTFFSFYVPTFFTIQALISFRNYGIERERNQVLQAEVSQAQLNALKMQLHPHFLFNSLHSISALILAQPERATRMVALLGDFLRQAIEHKNDQIVTLDEELQFLRSYLEIEKTRFPDRLTVQFEIEPGTLEARVPHLILQPLVENAVKHGIAPYESAGTIEISSSSVNNELLISVENTGRRQGVSGGEERKSNGIGISNVRSRLSHMYGDAGRLDISHLSSGGCRVEISIPYALHLTNGDRK